MLNFTFGFVAASALWFFGIINSTKVKEWYAAIKAKVVGPAA